MKNGKKNKSHKHSSLQAATIIRSATAQAERHHDRGFANTGTNISYEGATAPGSGGSAGTGYASGKDAVDETISTNSDYVQNRASHVNKKDELEETDESDDIEEVNTDRLPGDDFYLDDNF
jgi:hypothetical protein